MRLYGWPALLCAGALGSGGVNLAGVSQSRLRSTVLRLARLLRISILSATRALPFLTAFCHTRNSRLVLRSAARRALSLLDHLNLVSGLPMDRKLRPAPTFCKDVFLCIRYRDRGARICEASCGNLRNLTLAAIPMRSLCRCSKRSCSIWPMRAG